MSNTMFKRDSIKSLANTLGISEVLVKKIYDNYMDSLIKPLNDGKYSDSFLDICTFSIDGVKNDEFTSTFAYRVTELSEGLGVKPYLTNRVLDELRSDIIQRLKKNEVVVVHKVLKLHMSEDGKLRTSKCRYLPKEVRIHACKSFKLEVERVWEDFGNRGYK